MGTNKTTKEQLRTVIRHFKRDWQLWALIMIPVTWLIIFDFGPMYGLQIAFRNYSPRAGMTGSEWVGLAWFKKFLMDRNFTEVFFNTIALSLYGLAVGFPLPIVFALILHAMKSKRYKRVVQVVTYMPHFISTAVMVSIVQMLLSPVSGIYGALFQLFNTGGYPRDFRGAAETFRHIYVWSDIWQGLGWSTIIYTSALSSVSPELHDAAMVDGASRLKRIWHVDIPTIIPTICITLIMSFGGIVSVGFEKAYMLQTSLNLSTSEILSTYVYKNGMNSFKNFSYGTAVGLFNTAISLALMTMVNAISKKLSDDEVSLF